MVNDKQVWWAVLNERTVQESAHDYLLDVAGVNYALGFNRIRRGYTRTDIARNAIAAKFLQLSSNPKDTLVMLDDDHDHPMNVCDQLVVDDLPVVAGLAYLRGKPYNACAFVMGGDKQLHPIVDPDPVIYPVSAIGHAAIAIQRSVFIELEKAGHLFPWWRYEYTEYNLLRNDGTVKGDPIPFTPSEDMYFSRICRETGIPMYVDCSVRCPHLIVDRVTEETFRNHQKEVPELMDVRPVKIEVPQLFGLEDR